MSLEHALLTGCAVPHGFGTRTASPPPGVLRPVQVHGARVVSAAECAAGRPDADAVVARAGQPPVGVVTADCVPLLIAARDGSAVAAVHAGWRGIAAGVIEAGVRVLRDDAPAQPLRAVVGPHVGACCYEVDAPVLDALRHRHDAALAVAIADARPGHWWLDLSVIARHALCTAGVAPDAIGEFPGACTACDASRFHSYRRDGPRSGRLFHWIAARQT